MNEARILIYEDRKNLSQFDIYNEGCLNELIYRNWLLYRKELRKAKTDIELRNMMLEVFNDAYYICTVSLMHPFSSRMSRWFIQQTDIPSLVMPLVHLYLRKTGIATREIYDLLKLIEGDLDFYPEWKINYRDLKKAVKNSNDILSVSTFARRELTKELLSAIRWWSLTNKFNVQYVKNCIGFTATNLNEQKLMAIAISKSLKDFEHEIDIDYYCDDEGNIVKDSYDFSETYQLLTEITDSDKYSDLINKTALLEDIMPENIEQRGVRRGRPKNNPENIKASFEISNKTDNLNHRLNVFYQSLKDKGYIDKDTDQMVFIDMFKGGAPTQKIIWTRHIFELHYMFKKLDNMKLIKKRPKSVGLWQAVCSCFKIMKRNRKVGNKRKEYNYEPYDITPNKINKGGKLPKSHEELDYIISFLDPQNDILRALDSLNETRNEITDILNDLQVYNVRE